MTLTGLAQSSATPGISDGNGGGIPSPWAPTVVLNTSLTAMSLTGPAIALPLGSDPGNALGDSIDGYGLVNSVVQITLSSMRTPTPGPATLGQIIASDPRFHGDVGIPNPPDPIDPAKLNGQQYYVNSFFDVFFDITVTDVDPRPGRDFAGMSDGASIMLQDNPGAGMNTQYSAVFMKDAPNFGLGPPPEASPYIGHFGIRIPLGGDINGNGDNDVLKFSLAAHSVGDVGRVFYTLPGGGWGDEFNSAAFLEGAIVDETSDPPFTIGTLDPMTGLPVGSAFGGPTTGRSNPLNPLIPEPSQTPFLAGLGLIGLAALRRHRA